ncbi:hypothetical protein COY28_04115, partial [Candidatus Woesearchaeota archaeon CG_4_10_14_0_2_um_filter_57_5]
MRHSRPRAITWLLLFSLLLGLYANTWGLPEQLRYPDHLTGGVLKMAADKSVFMGSFHRSQGVYFLYAAVQLPYLGIEYLRGDLPVDSIHGIYDMPPRILRNIVLLGRILSALLTTLAVFLVYLAAMQFLSEPYALLAALLVATNTFVLTYAHYVTDLSPALLGATMVCYFLARVLRNGAHAGSGVVKQAGRRADAQRDFALLCASVGFAASMKYLFGFLILAPLLFLVPRRHARSDGCRARWLLLIPLVFLVLNPTLLVRPQQFLDEALFYSSHSSEGFAGLVVSYPVILLYLQSFVQSFWWPSTLLLLLALVISLRQWEAQPAAHALLLAVFLAFFGSWHYMVPRMLLVIVPSAALLVAWGVSRMRAGHILLVLLAACAILYGVTAVAAFSHDSRDAASSYLAALPTQRVLAATAVQEFNPFLDGNEPVSLEQLIVVHKVTGIPYVTLLADSDACLAVLSSYLYGVYVPEEDSVFSGMFLAGRLDDPAAKQLYEGLLDGSLGFHTQQ